MAGVTWSRNRAGVLGYHLLCPEGAHSSISEPEVKSVSQPELSWALLSRGPAESSQGSNLVRRGNKNGFKDLFCFLFINTNLNVWFLLLWQHNC